jgi:ABC-type transport system involved in multi-copper enzyme maturation permease subunit
MTATTIPAAPEHRGPIREFGSAVATIMTKELRSRMRGRRAFVILTLYLGLLALIAYGVQVVATPEAQAAAGRGGAEAVPGANASALIGQSIFTVLSILQVVLVSVLAPAFTAAQISLEREKQTLDLLISTPLRPGAIVVGKLLTALAFVVLMIVAAIPITAIVLMYGGASIGDIVNQQLILLATAIGFGAVGIFASALTKRTQSATVVTYCAVIACILGSAMLYSFWTAIAERENPLGIGSNDTAPELIRYVNPMVAMLDVVSTVEPAGGTRITRPLYEIFGPDLAAGFTFVDVPPGEPRGGDGREEPPPADGAAFGGKADAYWWPRFVATFLIAAGLFTLASMRLVVPTGLRRSPWPRRRRHLAVTNDPGIDDVQAEAAPEGTEL